MSGVAASLDWCADRNIDPAAEIYARVFAAYPDMERLFVRDSDGSVRANMMYRAFETVLDIADADIYGTNFVGCEVVNHENLGVPADVFVEFYAIMCDVLRDKIGDDWTPAMEAAWRGVIARIDETATDRISQLNASVTSFT